MTEPVRPSKQLTRDVAAELDRRKRRRRFTAFGVVAAVIAAAIAFVQCGRGWGLGGGGGGRGKSTGVGSGRVAPTVDAGPRRCTVRVAADGITVDGATKTRDEAVAACKATEGAMVTVTGDARQGDWDELRAGLEAVRVKIYIRGQLWDGNTPVTPAGSASGSGAAP